MKERLLIHNKVFEGVETNMIYSFTLRRLNLHPHGYVTDDQRYFHIVVRQVSFPESDVASWDRLKPAG